jgi:hypothetical protein
MFALDEIGVELSSQRSSNPAERRPALRRQRPLPWLRPSGELRPIVAGHPEIEMSLIDLKATPSAVCMPVPGQRIITWRPVTWLTGRR